MEHLTVDDVAARLGVSKRTVKGWIASGELVGINVAVHAGARKPRWRVTELALRQFEASRTPAVRPGRRGIVGYA